MPLLFQGANEGGINYGDEYLAELDYIEVVEGMKEGFESDVPVSEISEIPVEDTTKDNASDEEDNTKENTNDSDEDFNINHYVSCNKNLLDTELSSVK